jgi:hypothetical protein
VLNIIPPYIGPLIASVLAAILTMLSNLGTDFQSEILPLIYVLIGFGSFKSLIIIFLNQLFFSKVLAHIL